MPHLFLKLFENFKTLVQIILLDVYVSAFSVKKDLLKALSKNKSRSRKRRRM
jgi:hypothetical protein